MEYEINSYGYDIVFDSATIDTTIGEETIIEVEQAVNYIKSGEQEIKKYVDNVSKPELDNHVETVNKAEISRYITEEKQPEIDEYIDNYINNESKPELNNYLQNDIKPALQVFANEKTLEFDNNAQTKQALVDASAQAAANSEATSIEKANLAAQSASEAKTSETNARVSETNAKDSENSCKDILERLGTVIKIKGRVDSIENLPTSGNLNGDVYLVGAEGLESYPEYYWFDDHWEFIGISSDKLEWGTLQGTLSNQTDLQQALDGKVAITGDQTINHTKTFTSAITRRHEFTGGSAKTLTDVDTNGKGSIAIIPYYTGNKIYHRTYTENTTSGKHAYLDVTVDDSGVAGLHFGGSSSTFNVSFANATQVIVPTPATDDSSTKATTTANVDAKITAQAVKLTGNQTIAGSKTFSSSLITKTGGSAMLKGVLPNNTVGTNPSSDTLVYVSGVDNGGKDQSYINFVVKKDGTGQINLIARSNSSSDRATSGIYVARKLDGTSWTSISTTTASAPTPATSDNSTQIATTAFVNNIVNGKLVYDSGDLTLSSNTNSVITLSKALSSSELHKYQVIVLIKPTTTIQNFTTDMYLNAQSGYFYEKNNSIADTTGILTGLSTTQIRYKTGKFAVYYAEGNTYDWSNFKARFLIYKM